MRLKQIYLLIFLTISSYIFSNVDKGVIDLSETNFKNDEVVKLSGSWLIEYPDGEHNFINVPGDWDDNKREGIYKLNIISKSKERLTLVSSQINTYYTVVLNGETITPENEIRPLYQLITINIGNNLLEFHVKNDTNIYSGFRSPPYIGNYQTMLKRYEGNILKDTLFTGASCIMAIFFFVLFINYKKDKSTLFFALLCLSLSIRSLVTNEKLIFDYIPDIPYWLMIKLEYLTIYVIPLFLLLFIKHYFNKVYIKKLYNIVLVIGALIPIATIIFPSAIFISLLFPFYIYVALNGLYCISSLLYYKRIDLDDAETIILGLLSLGVATIYDIMVVIFNISDRLIMSNSMILFIVFMSFIVSKREVSKEKRINKLNIENIKVNNFLSKFVPNEFIKTMNMGSIMDIKRGDGVEKSMIVLFSSIKDFQRDFKSQNPEDTIKVLNTTYEIISPIITKNSGFIDKFIDETVMALFPGRVEDAIDAVLEINEKLELFNKSKNLTKPIRMRSGIHLGKQYIGIVGDHNRVDATVISKVVNTASRINDFTSKIHRDILLSEDVIDKLENKKRYNPILIGRVKLKGKSNYVNIYTFPTEKNYEPDTFFNNKMKKTDVKDLIRIEMELIDILNKFPGHYPSKYYMDIILKEKKAKGLA